VSTTKHKDIPGIFVEDVHAIDGLESERSLWAAVLLQMMLDATKPVRPRETSDVQALRARAIAFFRASTGVTARDFTDVCHLAGFDPPRFREQALAVIESGNPIIRKRISSILAGAADPADVDSLKDNDDDEA
jgi:hypothetical protein